MASNLRVLISNLGDGNWGPIYDDSDPPVLQAESPNLITNEQYKNVQYFPPGAAYTGSAEAQPPTAAQQIGSSVDTIGWGSKTNWMFQLKNVKTSGTHEMDVNIYGYRPTGVIELIKTVDKGDIGMGESFSYGGVGGEEVYGPFVAFKFEGVRATVVGTPQILCYVIGWNYGDVWDNQIDLT